LIYQFPYGIRLITDREGNLKGLIGMTAQRISGVISYKDKTIPFTIAGNERLKYIRLVQEPGWFSNKSCKMLRILPFPAEFVQKLKFLNNSIETGFVRIDNPEVVLPNYGDDDDLSGA
jgi:hypothetical protein